MSQLYLKVATPEKAIFDSEMEEARQRAQNALKQTLTDEEYATALTILEKTSAQLKVKRRHHSRI